MLRLENISKYYYSANTVVPALRKVKLELNKGEFVVITGESGSGKSTLLNVISGLDIYDEGELYINGEATSLFDDDDWEEYRKKRIGFVYQNYNLIENYSAVYNIESSLLIQGYNNKEAVRIAKELLQKVGLKNKEKQKASNLSSGEKQRLAIARALAKNTDIIVADEPTGNLDSETGRQIMELFGELSKDRLIIVVTHNYEETAPYVTRRLRLHEGEIVSDVVVRTADFEKTPEGNKRLGGKELPDIKTAEAFDKPKDKIPDSQIALRFMHMNLTTQPRRVLLFLSYLLFTAVISFIFIGEIYSNLDDTFTRDYDNSVFMNGDTTRIVVKKQDSSAITNSDMEAFRRVKHVEKADRYDYANDINYYITEGEDYEYTFLPKDKTSETTRQKTVNFLRFTRFMKSSACISKKELRAGRLPESRNEVVLYSKNLSLLGTGQLCYFTSQNMWGSNNYYSVKVKVVGLLKKQSDQVYFSGELCGMLSSELYAATYHMDMGKDPLTGKFNLSENFVPVIADDLKEDELRVSMDLVNSSVYKLAGECKVTVYRNSVKNSATGRIKTYDMKIADQYNTHSIKFVEVSKDWFDRVYSFESNQASLYITDYIDTNYVINKLKAMGYEGISAYRVSSTRYNTWKVNQRNTALGRSFLVLTALCLLEIIIMGAFLKLKYNNLLVLKSMGMHHRIMKKMNYYEMLSITVISVVITLLAANAVKLLHVSFMNNLIKYFNVPACLVFAAYNILLILITIRFFHRSLRRRQKWS